MPCPLVFGSPTEGRFAEQAVQSFAGMLRLQQLSLERRVGMMIPCIHLVVTWRIAHSVDGLVRYRVDIDGRRPSRGARVASLLGDMLEFGSMVMSRALGQVFGDRCRRCGRLASLDERGWVGA